MAKTKKAKPKAAAQDAPAKKAPAKKAVAKNTDDTQISKAKALISEAGEEGISADKLGAKLGILKKNMDAEARTKGLKTVRVLARKATGGSAAKRDGRSAVYTM